MDKRRWVPYVAGGLTGLLLVLSVWGVGEYAGASTSFVRSAGLIEKTFAAEHVAENAYYREEKVRIDWQWMFVLGIFVGALGASIASGGFKLEPLPPMWRERFGPNLAKRWLVAFAGGALALFGARLAGGCPSGHGLSGVMQLSVSGFAAAVCFFIGGIVVARMLYAGGRTSS